MLSRVIALPHPVDVVRTLAPLCRGRADPCMRLGQDEVWRATRTPEGPATVRLALHRARAAVEAWAWGPGAAWALETVPDLVGATDDDTGFDAPPGPLGELWRRHRDVRIPRSRAVVEALVPTILEQKVVGKAARRSYCRLVERYGEPAPGPTSVPGGRLLLPPAPERLAALPSWAFHPLNVERRRADAIRLACRHARALDEAADMDAAGAMRRLTALPGLGPWTAAEVALVALGDADAVPVGDFHLKNIVAWNLGGEPRGTDAEMLELLEPYRPHRGRVVSLLKVAGAMPPRYGARMTIADIRAM